MILKLKTLILRLKIWKTRNKQSRVDKVKKIAEYNEYRHLIREITNMAEYGHFSMERTIISDSTVDNLIKDGFDVRSTNFNYTYVISWRTIK